MGNGWRDRLRGLTGRLRRSTQDVPAAVARGGGAVGASLRGLLDDPGIPADVRAAMASDFRRVEEMLARIEHEELHVAVFGRVSAGKSALANALLGLGLRDLSMSPRNIPRVKRRIRSLDMVAATRRARAIMDQADSGRIAALLDDFNAMAEAD